MARLFGTDGVRGLVNQELTVELALSIGRALATAIRRRERIRTVLLARDTRRSGGMLQAAVASGLCSLGIGVMDLGVLPTPALAWCTRHVGGAAGVMISASHNPPEYNGIKIIGPDGFKLPDQDEELIEQLVNNAELAGQVVDPLAVGNVEADSGAVEAYFEFLTDCANGNLGGIPVVVDCGHGAAYRLAPRLMSALGADVTVINDQPDGININDRCGSTHPEVVAAEVRRKGAAVGFAFDGDADRCIAVDERGQVVDGDSIIAIAALHRHREDRLPGAGVVVTVMSNLGLELALRQAGITTYRTAVGDRYVLEELRRRGLVVGGEQSGHIAFLDTGQTTGDGLLTAVEVLNVMQATGKPLSELAAVVQKVPQRLVNVPADNAKTVLERPEVRDGIADLQRRLGDQGRILVRPSGTEPVIRVMVECVDEDLLNEALTTAVSLIQGEG